MSTDARIARRISIYRSYGMKDENWANHAIAVGVLNQELGNDENELPEHDYALDEKTRDRLIAHARQDAAHAYLNTVSIMRKIDRIHNIAIFELILTACGLVGIAFIVLRMF